MAKLTKMQLKSINEQCKNDWELDVQYCIFHGEKTLIKQIEIDNNSYLEFAIRYNYRNQISLHISKFYHRENNEFASTSGMGKSTILCETQSKRKNVKDLIYYTEILTNEKLLEINKNTRVSSGNGLILESEEF